MAESKWNLAVLSSGERSALRRCAGQMMGSSVQAMQAFYHALSVYDLPRYKEECYFAAMCMECLWREADHPQKVAFEEMLSQIYNHPDASDSMKRRTVMYMDLAWGEDGFLLGKICSLVKIMRAKDSNVMPDFERMAEDLCNWNNNSRFVQRKWVKTICVPKSQKQSVEKEK